MSIISIPAETPKTIGVLTPACGRAGGEALGKLACGEALGLGEAGADGLGLGEAQLQSASSLQAGLTQRLVPETLVQRKSSSHWASESQVSKQAVKPPKVNLTSQVVVCWAVAESLMVSLMTHSWADVSVAGAVQVAGLVVVEDKLPLSVLSVVIVQLWLSVPVPPET